MSGTPHQIGVSEWMNKTLLEKMRFLLSNASLSRDFLVVVANLAGHMSSISPSTTTDR